MSAEKIIVTARIGRSSRSFVWEPSAPAAIGHPFRWILEKTPSGVRVRDLQGTSNTMRKAETVSVLDQTLRGGARLEIANASITLRRLDPIPPAYAVMSPEARSPGAGAQPELFAFSGVRRTLLDCTPVHTAFVAYSRSRPAFTLYREADGLRIKVLLRGTMLKFRGEAPKMGQPGDTWTLSREQLPVATILRKWYWWRFNLATPQASVDGPTENLSQRRPGDDRIFKNALLGMGTAFALLVGALFLVPRPEEKTTIRKPEPPLVKLIPRHKPMIKPQVVAGQDTGLAGAPTPAAPAQTLAAPAPAAPAAPAPTRAPIVAAAVSPTPVKPKPTPIKPEVPKQSREQVAALAAAKSARLLRESLSGAMALAGRAAPVVAAPSNTDARGLFAASESKTPADIKSSFKGNGVNVGAIGGKGMGGKNGASGAGVGYGTTGELAGTGSSSGSFVSTDNSGGSINEGLSMDEVGAVITKHMGEVRYCHEAALVVNPRVEGKLLMDFDIDVNGRVKHASPKSSTLGNKVLEECIRARLVTWAFPKPRGAVLVPVSFPFIFKVLDRN